MREAKRLNLISPAATPKGGRQPHDKGYSRIADALGYNNKRVADAFLHASLHSSVRDIVVSIGLADNQKFLTKLARMNGKKAQTEYLGTLRSRGTTKKKARQTVELSPLERLKTLKQSWKKSRISQSRSIKNWTIFAKNS